MKKALLLASLFLLLAPVLALADTSDPVNYKMLAPIPFVETTPGSGTATANSYIPGIVQLVIAAAVVLAVVKIIFGGIQYMSTDSFNSKSDGKKSIEDALWGLLLAISAFVILKTINPDLVNLSLVLNRNEVMTGQFNASTTPEAPGAAWPSDQNVRDHLAKPYGVQVSGPSCTNVGQTHCTSVDRLGSTAQIKLIQLKQDCSKAYSGCAVQVTGGTEYWLHATNTQHQPGANVVDLRSDVYLSQYIKDKGVYFKASNNSCYQNHDGYTLMGSIFINEGLEGNSTAPHWHVCF